MFKDKEKLLHSSPASITKPLLLSLSLSLPSPQISGIISNTGHSVIFTAGNDTVANYDGMQTPVNISGGPLSYRYRFHEIHIHYGLNDQFGSEHSVEGYTFPAEVSQRTWGVGIGVGIDQ